MAVVFLLLCVTFLSVVHGQTQCSPNECIRITNCPHLLAILNKRQRTQQEVDTLRAAHCGYEGTTPKVCCSNSAPPSSPPPVPGALSCATPDGQIGQCIGLYSCPHIVQMLSSKPVSPTNQQFVQNSRCEGKDQYSVCCGPSPPATQVAPLYGNQCRLTSAPPDPRTECCGRDAIGGNRITGGNETAVDQYPWLVLIEYRKKTIKLLCGGALISGRYVLTAAHCITGPVLNSGTPVNIRLGEYDTSNDGADCVTVEGGGEDCTEPVVIIPIERTIPHPQYDPGLRRNDIGLIRMRNLAPYTDFIRPICLPSNDVTLNPPQEFTMFAAGWGAVNTSVSSSNVKIHVDLPYKTLQVCQSAYINVLRKNAVLWSKQVCAGGEKGKDSCKGDSGGPLMYENGRLFEIIGVVSYGPTPCGIENVPGVYTKVFEYNSWIRSQMEQ